MKKFFKDESGQGMVEYGLIIALIAVVVVAALALLGPKIKAVFNKSAGMINDDGTVNTTAASGTT